MHSWCRLGVLLRVLALAVLAVWVWGVLLGWQSWSLMTPSLPPRPSAPSLFSATPTSTSAHDKSYVRAGAEEPEPRRDLLTRALSLDPAMVARPAPTREELAEDCPDPSDHWTSDAYDALTDLFADPEMHWLTDSWGPTQSSESSSSSSATSFPTSSSSPPVGCSVLHGRCAIVGSSSSLLDAQRGSWIDGHFDTIARFNDAPTRGFEAAVGSRTTLRVLNNLGPQSGWLIRFALGRGALRGVGESAGSAPKGSFPDVPEDGRNVSVLVTCKTADCVRWFHHQLRSWRRQSLDSSMTLLSPPLQQSFLLANPRARCAHRGFHEGRQTTTGLSVILFALRCCDAVAVLGFRPWEYLQEGVQARYFDPSSMARRRPPSEGGGHDFDAETATLRFLQREFPRCKDEDWEPRGSATHGRRACLFWPDGDDEASTV